MEICYYTDVTRVLLHVFGAHFPRPMPVGCGRAGRPPARGLPSIASRRVPAAVRAPPGTPQGLCIRVSYMRDDDGPPRIGLSEDGTGVRLPKNGTTDDKYFTHKGTPLPCFVCVRTYASVK